MEIKIWISVHILECIETTRLPPSSFSFSLSLPLSLLHLSPSPSLSFPLLPSLSLSLSLSSFPLSRTHNGQLYLTRGANTHRSQVWFGKLHHHVPFYSCCAQIPWASVLYIYMDKRLDAIYWWWQSWHIVLLAVAITKAGGEIQSLDKDITWLLFCMRPVAHFTWSLQRSWWGLVFAPG